MEHRGGNGPYNVGQEVTCPVKKRSTHLHMRKQLQILEKGYRSQKLLKLSEKAISLRSPHKPRERLLSLLCPFGLSIQIIYLIT